MAFAGHPRQRCHSAGWRDDQITDASEIDLDHPESLGSVEDFFEARRRNMAEGRTAFGGDSQYSVLEEIDLEADTAWTEIEFRGEDLTEVWRLYLVREDGKWKVCDAVPSD